MRKNPEVTVLKAVRPDAAEKEATAMTALASSAPYYTRPCLWRINSKKLGAYY